MAIPEDDRVVRRTGGFRDQSNSSMFGIALRSLSSVWSCFL